MRNADCGMIQKMLDELKRSRMPEEWPAGFSGVRLTGDASTRSYYRITTPLQTTIILMKMPEAFDVASFPYLQNYQLFRSLGVNLAEIHGMEPTRGDVFLQDLGDSTFFELYGQWNEQTRIRYYVNALDALISIQKGHAVGGLSFDEQKFLWELNHFKKHFLLGLRGAQLSEADSKTLDLHFTTLSSELAARPRLLTHRDYHSRNLMVREERMYIIDFQDARYGPATYDLASLCYDSYIVHPAKLIQYLEQYFFAHHPDPETQRVEYPRMCLQRNLKALGTFGYQATQMGRDFYQQFVGPTLGYIRGHFEKLPEYAGLQKILAAHLPELR